MHPKHIYIMKVIIENSTAEIIEKKSRFIANIFYIEDVKAAEEKLLSIRKQYYDAKHNCFAYVIGLKGENIKSSDDGEPQGTAGHPMLDILKGNDLTNCIAIVTRYFGGTLLGTGGLVRAYSDSLKAAIANAKTSEIQNAYKVSFEINYDDYGKIENLVQNLNQLNENNIYSLAKTFENVVKLEYLISIDVFHKFKTEIVNMSRGKIVLDERNKLTYYFDNKNISIIK